MAGDHINALQVGHRLEEYEIERLLGHGGFGLTYLARDAHLDNLVAIKEYLPQEYAVRAANSTIVPKSQTDQGAYEWGLERFKHEARSLARFKHPNIVRAARLIEANGTAYMVMEYAHGMTLGDYLKHFGPTLDEATILAIFLPILDGLSALHRAEFIHRDIKPGNIYLREEGGPMLIDFGAVRQAVATHSQSLTSVVTPGYAPIEQYSTEGRQGPWTDLYAVGATMYCCMLGRSPVDAARRSAAISDGDKDPMVTAVRIGKEKQGYSDAFLEAIDWAMQFRSKDRPQSALDLKTKLLSSPVRPAMLVIPDKADVDRTTIGAGKPDSSGGPRSGAPSRPSQPFSTSRPGTSRPATRQGVSTPPSQPVSQPASVRAIPREPDEPTSLAPMPGPAGQRIEDEPTSLAPMPGPKGRPADTPVEVASAPVEWFADQPSSPAKPAPKLSAGMRIAQSSAPPPPPKRSSLPALLGGLVVVGAAAGGGWWWNEQRSIAAEDGALFEAAVSAGSPDAYRAYLENCLACAQQAAAEQAMRRLTTERESAADAVVQREITEKIADLKTRFARHVLAGELTSGPDGNASQVLEDLAIVAPADPFVMEGRERLAAAAAEAQKAAAATKAAAAPPPTAVAKSADKPVADSAAPVKAAPKVEDKPAAVAAAPKPAPKPAGPDLQAQKLSQVMDGIARFEVALARDDLNGAGVAVSELRRLAPEDALVRDAQKRFEMAQAKQAAARLAEQRKKAQDAARAAELQRIADATMAAAQTQAPRPSGAAPALPGAAPSALPGGGDVYRSAVLQKIQRNWVRPAMAPPSVDCELRIEQGANGEVLRATVTSCLGTGDPTLARSVETAVFRSSPLPLPANPAALERVMVLRFRPGT
jgi:serine/threonine protein kinase